MDGRLWIEPNPRPRYQLADLIAQCDFDLPQSPEEFEWLETSPTGREEI